MKWSVIGGVILWALAGPVGACSLSNWNIFESYFEPSLESLWDRSTTIDWVDVETARPAKCPWAAQSPRYRRGWVEVEACENGFTDTTDLYFGNSRESLKGSSRPRFPLARLYPSGAGWKGGYREAKRWVGFSDLRELDPRAEIFVARGERAIAETRHDTLEFWDRGSSNFRLDGSHSCGGQPTLDPRMAYVVFRSGDGSVLALEPVAHDDDSLLRALRERRDDPDAPLQMSLPVDAFFRNTEGLVLARVEVCAVRGRSREDEKAVIAVERGDAGFITEYQYVIEGWRDEPAEYEHGPPGARRLRYDDLPDLYAWKGGFCPVGERLLIVKPARTVSHPLPGDREWLERRFPHVFAKWGGPSSELFAVSTHDTGPERPIRVSQDGMVDVADIPTALRLIGAERVSVDQIFSWYDDGRSRRSVTPAPSSW